MKRFQTLYYRDRQGILFNVVGITDIRGSVLGFFVHTLGATPTLQAYGVSPEIQKAIEKEPLLLLERLTA